MNGEEEKDTEKFVGQMLNGMLESMMVRAETSKLVAHSIEEEGRAWDGYIGNASALLGINVPYDEAVAYTIAFADKVLEARRTRFNAQQAGEKMTSTLETMNEKCNNKLIGGKVCMRQAYHEGVCRS
jgi:hypothetical protein